MLYLKFRNSVFRRKKTPEHVKSPVLGLSGVRGALGRGLWLSGVRLRSMILVPNHFGWFSDRDPVRVLTVTWIVCASDSYFVTELVAKERTNRHRHVRLSPIKIYLGVN